MLYYLLWVCINLVTMRTCLFSKVGQTLPSIELHEGTPKDKVNILELFKGKKGILFAVPGAFTPGCSQV